MEHSTQVPQKTKNRAVWSSNFTPGYISKKKKKKRKDYFKGCMHPEFIAALFTIVKKKQPKCPSTDEWIKKTWYTYTMGYYLAKEWSNAICSNMDGSRDHHTKWNKSERKRQMSYDIT